MSDGTEAGTFLLADLCPGDCSSIPVPIGSLSRPQGPLLFFWASVDRDVRFSWVTDGTPEGTHRLAESLCSGDCQSAFDPLTTWEDPAAPRPFDWIPRGRELGVALQGEMVFAVHRDYCHEGESACSSDNALFASDGTSAGTHRLAGLPLVTDHYLALTLSGDGQRAVFRVTRRESEHHEPEELWVTDGTVAGTGPLDLGCASERIGDPAPFGSGVAFIATCSGGGTNLYVAGSAVAPARPLGIDGAFSAVVVGGRLYALRGGGEVAVELWQSDGTSAGTAKVMDVDATASGLLAIGGRLALQAGTDLLLVDGAGTPVKVNEAPFYAPLENVGPLMLWWETPDWQGRLWYVPGWPEEWWLVSYSPEAGRRVEQVFHAQVVGDPHIDQIIVPPRHRLLGHTLYLGADGGDGDQLWRLNLADVSASCFSRAGAQCLRDGRFEVKVDFHNQHNGGTAGTATPDAATRAAAGDTGYFWFFRPDNLELAVKVLDGRPVDGHWWVFAGGTTDLEYDLTVYDHVRGEERSYHHAAGDLCAVVDTAAFAEVASAGATRASGAAEPATLVAEPAGAAPGLAATAPGCDPVSGEHVCLGAGDRFSVGVTYTNQHAGGTVRTGMLSAETPDSASVRVFPNGGVETLVKVLDGRPVNGHWWVLWGGLTDLGYTLEVADRDGDTVRTWVNPPASRCGGADTTAFSDSP